ncbi:short transient receptor potential channel 4-like [Branchiostoma floridae]|uniref:Short transient receptor potential channel 4-like n=1 Tax=Branchiostoma floridae TaxID=7739 RepID=A0A9J7MQQ4_BRAFL|nr:short transient receptor potential channel 4-like [Branchiostoma floridae]
MDLYRKQDADEQIEDAVFSVTKLPILGENSQLQRRFLSQVKDGDSAEVEEMLTKHVHDVSFTIDCLDPCGRSVVELATIRGNQEMVETLLRHGADLGDSLLYAVDLEKEDIVTTLLSYPRTEGSEFSTDKGTPKESLFSSHVTPLLLAAHRNNYSILKLLLYHQCPLPIIGDVSGSTDHRAMLDYYRAVTSPSYILLTSQDPFETAFKLKEELNNIVSCLETGKREFQELSARLEEFTAELINFARCPKEVMTVLNAGDNMEDIAGLRMRQLQKAIEVGHKKFVAHNKCQELLNLQFYRRHHGVLYSTTWKKMLAFWICKVLTPVLALVYMVIPKAYLGEAIASPVVKFNMRSWSWLLFLTITILLNGDLESTEAYVLIGTYYCWVLGMVWEKVKEIWTASVDAWNKWDMLLLLCHVTAMGCFTGGIVAIQKDVNLLFNPGEWNPFFIGSYFLAIAVILSFARYMSMLMFSETIGPLLLSMYKMVVDIFRFIIVFLIIIVGFATALQRLYSSPRPDSDCLKEFYQARREQHQANNTNVNFTAEDFCYYGDFAHLHKSIFYLCWTLYGKFEFTDLDVTAPNAVQFPVVSIWLSRILFITYITTSIIIMLNILIAMMSDSFSSVSSDAEVEWRFARSREMLKYIPKGRTLPPPFNLIPSPKSGWYFLKWLVLICRGQKLQEKDEIELRQAHGKYKVTVKRLKARYLLAYRLHRDQAEG